MKKIIIVFIICLFLAGCASAPVCPPCPDCPSQDVTLVLENGMFIVIKKGQLNDASLMDPNVFIKNNTKSF